MITTQTLKNAARAIEHDLWTDPSTQASYLVKDWAILRRWEPEHDNAETLILAMALGIEIHPDLQVSSVYTAFMIGHLGFNGFAEFEDYGDNALRAARAVVLISAARIGAAL